MNQKEYSAGPWWATLKRVSRLHATVFGVAGDGVLWADVLTVVEGFLDLFMRVLDGASAFSPHLLFDEA